MQKVKHYLILGDPIALARARLSKTKFYDSQKHLKLVWGLDLRKQHNDEPFLKGPLFMDVIFYMPIPKGHSQKKIDSIRDQWHIFKPDNSNLLKLIEDVGTKICYQDDCVIAKHCMEKVYDDGQGPRTEFILRELGPRQHRELL